MVMDRHGMSHKAAGTVGGGQYEGKAGGRSDDDLDDPQFPSVDPPHDGNPTGDDGGDAGRTRELLERTSRVEVTADGPVLYDANGNMLDTGGGLDYEVMRSSQKVKDAVRSIYRSDLNDRPAAERRRLMRQAWYLATPYDRRRAIDTSRNRRYIPAGAVARSLKRRKDQEAAVQTLIDMHYEDASAAMNVIRAGYPNNKDAAWKYINYTKYQRYSKDTVGKDGVAHHKGEAIVGDYINSKGKPAHGPLPDPKGKVGRSHLRMVWQPTNGVPDAQTVEQVRRVFKEVEDEPETQAQMFWDVCYGDGHPSNLRGDVDFAKGLIGQRKHQREGVETLNRWSQGQGQGNAARMLAYDRALSPEAARIFLQMEPGDGRLAHTQYPGRKGGKTYVPKRLTEMRSYIRAVYEISD